MQDEKAQKKSNFHHHHCYSPASISTEELFPTLLHCESFTQFEEEAKFIEIILNLHKIFIDSIYFYYYHNQQKYYWHNNQPKGSEGWKIFSLNRKLNSNEMKEEEEEEGCR